ncbi:hypothetical protein CICLE_v10018923mg [Citrus x clementina]|uniref:FCP1 homology domain-containing protein n=1 Tax=Citrus clementina TaxID=85681 RepID=V4TVR3_CITCL|nr:uncharacterized protein LOC18048399 isoform X1 [Citrus x clementina]XP_024044257.1 uncharacterized protein LOC18048399 isoform X1 [Citrus x clementina]ESR54016.1 hypothetical protein CICLE_v10018923mg [Citrus x clementina]
MDLEIKSHNAEVSSSAAKRKRNKRNRKTNALCNNNDRSHDCPEGASLMQDIPLKTNSCAESTIDISSNSDLIPESTVDNNSSLIEAQYNSGLAYLENKKKVKGQQKQNRDNAPTMDSTESTVDVSSNPGLIEACDNSPLMRSGNKKNRKRRRRKRKSSAPKTDNTDADLQEVTSKTMTAPFGMALVDMITKAVSETDPLEVEASGDTSLKTVLAAAPKETNVSVGTSAKLDFPKNLSRSKRKRLRRKLYKESIHVIERDAKDCALAGDKSLKNNMLQEKHSSLQPSVDICSQNELVVKQSNGDVCLLNGHNAFENNGVIDLHVANGEQLEKKEAKCAPKVADLDLTTMRKDFPISEKQSSSSNSANRSLMENDDVHPESHPVSSETRTIITYKRKKRVKTYIWTKKKKCSNLLVNDVDCIKEDGDSLMKNVSLLTEGHIEQKLSDKLDKIQITVHDASHGNDVSDEIPSHPKEYNISGHDRSCKLPKKQHVEVETKTTEGFPPSHLGVVESGTGLHDSSEEENHSQTLQYPPGNVCIGHSKKKLLVLDLNGLLVDIVASPYHRYRPDKMVSNKAVFKRPCCDEFLSFCFERFNVGVWSSRVKKNLDNVIDFLLGDSRQNLLFCWDASQCSETGLHSLENKRKPLVLKELKKLWEKIDPNLPWKKGEYNETNTLLLDDSPYKALCNPAHTAIFPYPYDYRNAEDSSLGHGGDLRVYLEGLADAENVQEYVRQNPFGQEAITERNPSWGFYSKIFYTKLQPPPYDDNSSSKATSANSFEPHDGGNTSSTRPQP